jgi:cytoskeletal protein RodZ
VSSLLNPIGPEPSSVYWIRRGAIIVVAITVIVALWWLIGGLLGRGGATATPEAGGSAQASSAASSDTGNNTNGDTGASAQASSAASAESTTSQTPVTACPDSVIKVEATTDSSTYPVGSSPKLTITVINTGDVTCKRDVGAKANELEITSGGYHVWSSDDCSAGTSSKIQKLKPGAKAAATISWNGRLSQKGCPNGPGAAAKAGRYELVGRNGKVTSDPTAFALTAG